MKKNLLLGIFFWLFIFGFSFVFAQQKEETLSITTYYPSPFGTYRQLRLLPTGSGLETEAPCNSANEGSIYYSSSIKAQRICRKTESGQFKWKNLRGGVVASGSSAQTNINWQGDGNIRGTEYSFTLDDSATIIATAYIETTGTGDAGWLRVNVLLDTEYDSDACSSRLSTLPAYYPSGTKMYVSTDCVRALGPGNHKIRAFARHEGWPTVNNRVNVLALDYVVVQ